MRKLIFITVMCAFITAPAMADMVQYASDAWGGTYWEETPGTIGVEFIANQNLTLSALGILDYGKNGLYEAHDVALWRSDGTLLASVTIGAGTTNPLLNGYRWADANPVALVAGTHYVLGAHYTAPTMGTADWFRTTATIDPAFTQVGGDRETYGASIAMPVPSGYGLPGLYGPNLQAVPVPAAVLLGMLGLSVAGIKLRKHA